MSYRWDRDVMDSSGRLLTKPRRMSDAFRQQAVWAVYQFRRGSDRAVAQSSDFTDLATATIAADSLNARRNADDYYKVFRLADIPL